MIRNDDPVDVMEADAVHYCVCIACMSRDIELVEVRIGYIGSRRTFSICRPCVSLLAYKLEPYTLEDD